MIPCNFELLGTLWLEQESFEIREELRFELIWNALWNLWASGSWKQKHKYWALKSGKDMYPLHGIQDYLHKLFIMHTITRIPFLQRYIAMALPSLEVAPVKKTSFTSGFNSLIMTAAVNVLPWTTLTLKFGSLLTNNVPPPFKASFCPIYKSVMSHTKEI